MAQEKKGDGKKENGKYGMMDAEMNAILPPVYRVIKKFRDYFVTLGCGNDLYYLMDGKGNLVSTIGFKSIQPLTKSHLLVNNENKVDLNCSQSDACTDCVFDIILSHRLEDIK